VNRSGAASPAAVNRIGVRIGTASPGSVNRSGAASLAAVNRIGVRIGIRIEAPASVIRIGTALPVTVASVIRFRIDSPAAVMRIESPGRLRRSLVAGGVAGGV